MDPLKLLLDFLGFAIPKIPALLPIANEFWGSRDDLGPMPPDLAAWAKVDAAIDEQLAARKAMATEPDSELGASKR